MSLNEFEFAFQLRSCLCVRRWPDQYDVGLNNPGVTLTTENTEGTEKDSVFSVVWNRR